MYYAARFVYLLIVKPGNKDALSIDEMIRNHGEQ